MAKRTVQRNKEGKLEVKLVKSKRENEKKDRDMISHCVELIFEGRKRSEVLNICKVKWPGFTQSKLESNYYKARQVIRAGEKMRMGELLHYLVSCYEELITAFQHIGRDDLLIQAQKQKEKLLALHETSKLAILEREGEAKQMDKNRLTLEEQEIARKFMWAAVI